MLVRYEIRDGAAWITLANPAGGNAFSGAAAAEMEEAVDRAGADGVGVIVIAAEGRFFSVGGDLAGFGSADDLPGHMADLAGAGHRIITKLVESDAIVVTVVAGTAAGIGFPIAAAGDLVLAAETASFTLGYTRVGLTGDGGTGLLTRTLGLHRTLRLALLNERLSATKAQEAGLVAAVFAPDELEAGVTAIVTGLVAGSRGAQAGIKHNIREAVIAESRVQLDREADRMVAATRDPDAREGVAAFLEKRSPQFRAQ